MNSTVYSFDIDFVHNSQTEEHGAHDTIDCLPGVCHTDEDDFVRLINPGKGVIYK